MISDDKLYEIITAGINRFEMPGADVKWNEKVDGRQFDVLATVPIGRHLLLLAYEVKHHGRKTEVADIEAFITKAGDIKANKMVFVSTKGFQSGCFEKAKKHNVDLFQLELIQAETPRFPASFVMMAPKGIQEAPFIEMKGETLANNIEKIELNYRAGKTVTLPDEPTQMEYYLRHTVTASRLRLFDLIDPYAGEHVELNKSYQRTIPLNEVIVPPDEFFIRGGFVESVSITVKGVTANLLGGNVRMDVTAFSPKVRYTNMLTGDVIDRNLGELPLGGNSFTAQQFYFCLHPLRYYYCDQLAGDEAKLIMVESFQSGELVRAMITVDPKDALFYIPVPSSNTALLRRLNARLKNLNADRSG